MILRTAQRALSQYEWHQHRLMVAGAGVDEHQVAELSMWRTFPALIDAERAALALTDALFDGCGGRGQTPAFGMVQKTPAASSGNGQPKPFS